MSHQPFSARRVFTHLTGLDFGLRVRIQIPTERTVLSVSENLSVQSLTSELIEIVSGLTVYSYAVRGRLEQLSSRMPSSATSSSGPGPTRGGRLWIWRRCS